MTFVLEFLGPSISLPSAHYGAADSIFLGVMQRTLNPVSAPYSIYLAAPSNEAAVLLFHGITGLPAEVSYLAEALHSQGFTVYAPCLSGHGTSIDELRRTSHTAWLQEAELLFQHIAQRSPSRIIVGGLSFGALLALHLAAAHPDSVSAGVLLSAPLRFNSRTRELMLSLLSYLPEQLLNMLPTVRKTVRQEDIFAVPRQAYSRHSVAAAARLVRIRRELLPRLADVYCPLLLLQDPNDHHLAHEGGNVLRTRCRSPIISRWFPNGQHELTIGHSREDVVKEIVRFLTIPPEDETHAA